MALVMVGPDPRGVSDDPEASEVLNELIELYQTAEHKDSIAILVLNIENRHENHLLVNALQSLATIVVQNSIQEGFGLTLTEALFKGKPCIASKAHGLTLQV
jgi:trehalose synthase